MIENFKSFLVIVAHPDDDILGCGATLSKLVKLNKKIKVVFVAEGTSCRFPKNKKLNKKIQKEIKRRSDYAVKALGDIGVKNYKFYNLKCGKLNSYPITEIANIVENQIKKFKPDIIFTHSDNDVNIDHRTVYQACLQSTRPSSRSKITGLFSFEILSSTEWKFRKIFEPNYFYCVNSEIKTKIKALKRYKSEIKNFPHPRSVEGIKTLAKYRGVQSHNKFSEAFKIIRLFS